MNVVELSGGVGGARLARGLAAIEDLDLTLIVNVGDDETIHGLRVSPDIDTVIYTLAGVEGPEGWGSLGDTLAVNDELGRLGMDNRFRLGDLDLALNLYRTHRLAAGEPLARITDNIREHFG
ncbi:MAG TPA: 2-phospho-L-lactate transferase CofD family protein, partial [Acidimicrobiia bacterium]|nr:2-phospho-L-lactate transferase CofD family protein [Acidimicrobiia bacterium]